MKQKRYLENIAERIQEEIKSAENNFAVAWFTNQNILIHL
jgi:ubiquinone biosynthesis protein UbiJ